MDQLIELREVVDAKGYETIKTLFLEYEHFLGVNLDFQGFAAEIASLPGKYKHPEGGVLLAELDGRPVGCVALRKLEPGICEMKRLFVQPQYRGLGLGKKLSDAIMEKARELNYIVMRLDTLAKLRAAVALYKRLGFKETRPYYDNPLPGVIYMEKVL